MFGGNGFDAVFFNRKKIPEVIITDFNFLSLAEKELVDHNVVLDTDRWLVILYERTNESDVEPNVLVYYQACLGDPIQFSKNQVKAGSEGFLTKACKSGYLLAFDILKPAFETNPDLFKRLGDDYRKFLNKHGMI